MSDTNGRTPGWERYCAAVIAELVGLSDPLFGGGYPKPEDPQTREDRMLKRASLLAGFAHRLVKEGLDAYGPVFCFSRPASLPADDGVLRWHLLQARRANAPKASRDVTSDFASWREGILAAEDTDGSNLLLLLRAAVMAANAPEGTGQTDARKIINFVEEKWPHARIPRPLPRDDQSIQALANRIARDERRCPTWLLWDQKPPQGVRVRPPPTVGAPDSSPGGSEEPEERVEVPKLTPGGGQGSFDL